MTAEYDHYASVCSGMYQDSVYVCVCVCVCVCMFDEVTLLGLIFEVFV